jgi:K+/H+ antiporter YhaU regulatory subunit KhtT
VTRSVVPNKADRNLKRTVEIDKELESFRSQISIIDQEIAQISSDSEVLASALGELSSYIKTDICPVAIETSLNWVVNPSAITSSTKLATFLPPQRD